MKKGFIIGLVIFVGLAVWWGWFVTKPLPEEYTPKSGEIVSQSGNTRSEAVKIEVEPEPEPEPEETVLVQSAPVQTQKEKEVKPTEKPGRQFDVSRLSQVRNRDEFLALMKESGAKYFDSSKGDVNITLNLKSKEKGE